MRRIIGLPGGTVKAKVRELELGKMDGVMQVCLASCLLVRSIAIEIDAQIAELCREPLGALIGDIGALAFRLGALAFRLGALAFRLGVLAFHLGALAFHLGALAFHLGAFRVIRQHAPLGIEPAEPGCHLVRVESTPDTQLDPERLDRVVPSLIGFQPPIPGALEPVDFELPRFDHEDRVVAALVRLARKSRIFPS